MSRSLPIGVAALSFALGALGCERPDPTDPHEFVAAETARVAHAQAHVTCRCDADAGLHVVAPEGSIVTVPPDAVRDDAEADIVVASSADDESEASNAPGTRIRGVVSLGFIGDNKLTESPPGYGYDDRGFYPPDPPYYYSFGVRPHRFRPGVGRRGGFHGGHIGASHVGASHIGASHVGASHIGGSHIGGGGHVGGGSHGGHGGHGR